MTELVFLVEEDHEGGYAARAAHHSIFTEADDVDALRANVRDAVDCHFNGEDEERPKFVRLHFTRDEIMPL
jgi:hypothetical protein